MASIESRFWSKIDRRGPDECWEWQERSRHEFGYGVFRPTKASGAVKAHRYAWELANGPIPAGLVIRHRCDNPPCCNPRHLESGTQLQNVRDAVARARHRHGEIGSLKLRESDILTIREEASRGVPLINLAEKFGISGAMASMIVTGKRWSHLGGPRTSGKFKSHCVNGHVLSGDNLIPRKGSKGRCRTCTLASQAKYRNKLRKAS